MLRAIAPPKASGLQKDTDYALSRDGQPVGRLLDFGTKENAEVEFEGSRCQISRRPDQNLGETFRRWIAGRGQGHFRLIDGGGAMIARAQVSNPYRATIAYNGATVKSAIAAGQFWRAMIKKVSVTSQFGERVGDIETKDLDFEYSGSKDVPPLVIIFLFWLFITTEQQIRDVSQRQ